VTAVIFDCDGTLVDSEPVARAAWQRTLARYGYAVTDADAQAGVGLPYARVHAYYAERVALPPAAELWTDFSAGLFALFEARLAPFRDAIRAVRELRQRGIPMAVASSSARVRLQRTLARMELLDAFDTTVAGDEVARAKPAPDIFLAAARRLGVPPADCVVVEDSPPGVAAGRAAGMVTLAVCRVPGTEGTLAEADQVLSRVDADVIVDAARSPRTD
jgi:HAD superfamily hydrolase (TIGR01509 family)